MTVSLVRVGEISEQIRGVTYGKSDAVLEPENGYLPVLRAGNITAHGLNFDDLVYVPAERISAKQRIRKGDVLIAASSGSLDVVGKAAMAHTDYDGGFGAFCKVLRPKSDLVCPSYFSHYFQTREYRQKISALAAGANINNLRNEHLDDLIVPLPPLLEQRRIAVILDQVDALRAKRREALAQLDALTQSIFMEMFGDPATNPKGWIKTTLESVAAKVTDGEHLTPRRVEAGIKLLSAKNVRDGYLDFGNVDYIDEEEYSRISKRCNPERGDILISCSGSIGRVASVDTDEPLALVRSAALVKPDLKKIRPKFLEAYLRTPFLNRLMVKSAHSSSQANLFQGPIRALPILLPSLEIQDEFVSQLKIAKGVREAHVASAHQLESLLQSLQHSAFRGEI